MGRPGCAGIFVYEHTFNGLTVQARIPYRSPKKTSMTPSELGTSDLDQELKTLNSLTMSTNYKKPCMDSNKLQEHGMGDLVSFLFPKDFQEVILTLLFLLKGKMKSFL